MCKAFDTQLPLENHSLSILNLNQVRKFISEHSIFNNVNIHNKFLVRQSNGQENKKSKAIMIFPACTLMYIYKWSALIRDY